MSLFNVFEVAGSAMNAQSQRLNVVASNLANADSATSSTGQAYKARQVVFKPVPMGDTATGTANGTVTGVAVAGVIEDPSPMKRIYDPQHPLADEQGYVTMPNVNVVEEMVNMISASRSYQDSAEMMNTAKTMLLKTLTLGQ